MGDDEYFTLDELVSSETSESAVVYGAIEDEEEKCTFPKGYLKRQAVFACKTCYEITGKRAGVCYECSMHCHAAHEIIELYTKRHFRCDCGNSKFKGAGVCSLWEEKDDVNIENKYDHTFDGVFCTCLRPYPDPEIKENEEMYQCSICEDWFHLQHLNMPFDFQPNDDFEELVCPNCVKRFPFLWLFYYCQMQSRNAENANHFSDCSSPKKAKPDDIINQPEAPGSTEACRVPYVLSVCGVEKLDPPPADMVRLTVNGFPFPSPIFWCNDWRTDTLCDCNSCEKMLENMGLEFLLDPEDSVVHYMAVGRQRVAELHARRESICRFKEALTNFLTKPREQNVVTEEEVKEFCEDLKKDL
ncbi:unnamed protein product [Hydatigera taeniaeformis]|uniref:UBR-type domain-containing protein n=1 Tax=Hydatigena taeniaeformis TaxID=6205 RepID=A0A0R3WII4_HYDTA|nr:unnamed protein product [Hydatigera taeniaeformis]